MRCDQCGCTLLSCQCDNGPQNQLLTEDDMTTGPIDVGTVTPDEVDAIIAERAKLSGTQHEHSHMLGGYRSMYQLLHEKFNSERERMQREIDELRTTLQARCSHNWLCGYCDLCGAIKGA